MLNVADHVRSSYAGLSLDELLQQPVAALLAVSSRAADALLRIGVETVFDLGSSWVFANAASAISASESRPELSPSDLLHSDVESGVPDDVAELALGSLRGISADDARALGEALEVSTVRELALWPPRAIARRLVRDAAGATGDGLEEDQAEALRPRLGEYPTERVYYDTLVMLGMGDTPDRRPLQGAISFQPVIDTPAGFGQPAVGALVTFSQSWYAKGITLGHMLHSLALAPGEATRIAVIDWSRRTRAAVSETIDEAERLDTATEHSRAISEVQNAVADEMQTGGSMSSGWAKSTSKGKSGGLSVGGGIAGAYQGVTGVLGFGGGTASSSQEAETTTEASSSSWSVGSRSVMAEMAQHVNDRTEQHSTSVRNRRASAVREVAQSEHEEVSTRIVANYNHMHALTVQYYEVVQIYRVLAQIHGVHRVLFLPFELLDFTRERAEDIVARFRARLVAAALTRRVRLLLLDDRGSIEIRSAVRVLLPIFAGEIGVGVGTIAVALMRPGTAGQAPSGGDTAEPLPPGGSGESTTSAPPPGRRVIRPGPMLDAIVGDAVLISVSFANVVVDRVRIDQAGVPAAVATYVVPTATNQVDFSTPIPLRTVESIHVAKTAVPADAGDMTLRYDCADGERTLVVAVDLGEGTGMQKVAFFAADRADRKQELMTHLQANRAYYTRAVLAGLDSASLVMLLSAFTWKGKPLADQVEPNPLAVSGNFLVLRAPVEKDEASGLGEDGSTWGELLESRALTSGQQDARLVPIPTGGVFAEAVLGRSNASEKLDITRFWNWQDSPIPLQPPEIAPVTTGSRATAEDLKPGQLGAPVLNIVTPTALPAPTGLGAALNTLATANLFRDMSGLAGTQALAESAAAGTLDAATAAGQLASANLKTVTDQAVAMGQTAADMWKSMHAPGSGGDGGGSRNTVSAEGARINQGRDLDRRGVTDSSGSTSESGNRMTESQSEFQAAGGGGDQMTSAPISRELAFTDIGAAGVSTPLMSGLVNALAQKGGGSGGSGSTTTSTPTDAAILKQLRLDLIDVGKEFDPKLDLKKVKVLSMATHVNGTPFMLPEVSYQAWTNSDTEVYVNLASFKTFLIDYQNAGNTAAEAMTLTRGFFTSFLRHEVEHVRQFQKNKNSPPTKFADMVLFERAAYGRSADWIKTGDAEKYLNKRVGMTTTTALAAQLKQLEGIFTDTVLFLKTVPTSGNDKSIRNILIAGPPKTVPPSRYLPLELPSKSKPTQPLQDYDIGHLYKGAP